MRENESGASYRAGADANYHAEGMEERYGEADAILLCHSSLLPDVSPAIHDVVVRERDRLGQTGAS